MEKILIGKIIKPQGIRGEVKVQPLTDDLETVSKAKALYLDGGDTPVAVEACAIRGGCAYILLEGVSTRNNAEALRGRELYAEKKDEKLKKGVYYIKDIIGCRLFDSGGAELGIITEIGNYGAADVYTACNEGKTFRFPFIKALKAKVDIGNKAVTVDAEIFTEVCVYED